MRVAKKVSIVAPFVVPLVALAFCAGCCHQLVPFVPVREALYRTEVAVTNRVTLPLTEEGRKHLLQYLVSGRNPALDNDGTIDDPEASSRYPALLNLLANPLPVESLIADEQFNPTAPFRPWFPQPALRQVVDAHEDWPLQRQPYAFLDVSGRYWWIFYHERRQLTHVLISRALETRKAR